MNLHSPVDALLEIIHAQGTLFSSHLRRLGLSMAWVIGVFVFLAFALVSAHALLWTFLISVMHLDIFLSAVAVCAVDLFLMIFCIIAALVTRKPKSADKDARKLRDEKLQEFKEAFAWSAIFAFGVSPVGKAILAWFFNRLRGKKDK